LGIVFAPYAVVLIGAHEGIMLANFLGGLMPIVMLPRIWSQIEWDKVLWLGLPAVAVMPGAAWLSSISPPGPLYLVVASLVLLSLVISVLMARVATTVDGRTAQVVTGFGIGMGTVLGGVGGPAATVYAVLSRWPALPMVATLQPLWILVSMCPSGRSGRGTTASCPTCPGGCGSRCSWPSWPPWASGSWCRNGCARAASSAWWWCSASWGRRCRCGPACAC